MPTYEYNCEKCGRFEKFEKITASPLTQCPECGGEVHRVISTPGIIFKGSGFYVTDSRSNSQTDNSSTSSSSSGSEKAS